ncbi:uncharacterized protein LOC117115582 [Anneissia japonica]|uniref:uncharacterized protein LOC117115582 n=1 Tax=Anneissia japonica TaxID=1529436 RepID=UPI0014259400|nr:uncharacterized protein LOC117115582 [Anneissia japonica]
MVTKTHLRQLLDSDVSPSQASKYYNGVRAFYETAWQYALTNLPIKDDVLSNAKFTNVLTRENLFSQVEYFVNRFKELLPYSTPEQFDKLAEEFTDYQLLDIPEAVLKEAKIEEDGITQYRIDRIWHSISNMKTVEGTSRFPRLVNVAKLVLVIPHSNAEEERIFSMVRKNKTSFRSNLDPKGTLSSILTVKLAQHLPVHAYETPTEILKKAKGATWAYNQLHSSKESK